LFGNIVAAGFHPLPYPGNGQIGRGKAQKDKFYGEALLPPHGNVSRIAPTTQRGFKSETISASDMFENFLQHQTPGLDSNPILIKGSKTGGNQICIDKYRTIGLIGEKFFGKGRLTGSVWPSKHDDSASAFVGHLTISSIDGISYINPEKTARYHVNMSVKYSKIKETERGKGWLLILMRLATCWRSVPARRRGSS